MLYYHILSNWVLTGSYHFDNRTSPMSCPENRPEMGYERGMKLSTIVVVHPIERMP